MSTKVRALRKKLKAKEEQNQPPKPEVTNITTSKLNPQNESTKKKPPLLFQPPVKRRDSYIDPLEYFKKEHELNIKDDENNILINEIFAEEKSENEEEKKEQKPRPKPKGGMMMMGMPMPMGGKPCWI